MNFEDDINDVGHYVWNVMHHDLEKSLLGMISFDMWNDTRDLVSDPVADCVFRSIEDSVENRIKKYEHA